MKQKLYLLILASLLLLAGTASCTDEPLAQDNGSIILPNGDIRLRINATIPVPPQVITRDIDPDGLGVNTLWLFCFNEYGEYIGRREASGFPESATQDNHYEFTVSIPGSTRIIHFLANVYLDDFNDRDNYGRNETTVIPAFVSASGRMCYWGRKQFVGEDELNEFAGNILLYRNQAKVRWELSGEAQSMQVFGYAICNRRAWGTIAPFNANAAEGKDEFDFDLSTPYVTEPAEEYQVLASDPTQVTEQGSESEGDPHYIFENPNTLDAPVYAIMHIGQTEDDAKYYKIMFVDDDKNQLKIYRNYEYVIRITGLPPSMGYDSFDAAKEGVAANNAWVSVDPEIPSLTDGKLTLNIPGGTTQMFTTGGEQSIAFTYDGNKDGIHVEWLEDGGNVSSTPPTLPDPDGHNYSIGIDLNTPTAEPRMGTLLLRAGQFTRQIKVYLMQPFSFDPVWVSTGVPIQKGERMSMTFVVPDTYPAELFPFECKISTNKMNANSELSGELPIVMEDTKFLIDGDSVKTTWGYKYVYTVQHPGIQEVFFTLNTSDGTDQGVSWGKITNETWGDCPYSEENHGHVFLQAENFEDAHRLVRFQDAQTERRHISFVSADQFTSSDNPGFQNREVSPTVNQEFLVTLYFVRAYTNNYNDREVASTSAPQNGTLMRVATTATEPTESEKDRYLTENEVRRRNLPITNNGVYYYYYQFDGNTSELTLHFVTTSSDVEDLIRFSIDQENNMNGDNIPLYKSAGVKLTANPVRFDFGDFTVNDDNPDVEGVKYGLNHEITVSFTLPKAAVQYTDATFLLETKNLIPDETKGNAYEMTPADGGYKFTIPQQADATTDDDVKVTLNFLTNRIANGETLRLSAINNTALFNPATATFSNSPIHGTLKLASSNGTDVSELLNTESFITLERKNGTRVGIITVESVDNDGVASYRIDLRTEYDFTMDEELTIYYNSLESTPRIFQATTTFQILVDDAEKNGKVELITLRQQ